MILAFLLLWWMGRDLRRFPLWKYLGNVISADMKDDFDIMRQCRQLYAQYNALARRFHMCSDNVKVTLFRSPLCTSQLWWKYNVSSIMKLYVAYNNAFRRLFRLPRDCSASGMLAIGNSVMSCPTLVRKLVNLVLTREWKPPRIELFRLSVALTSGGNRQLEHTGINYCMFTTLAGV